MSWQETRRRDEEVRRLAYHRGVEDALDGMPEDPDPGTLVAGEGAYRLMLVLEAYIAGRVDGGAELPF